MKKEEVEKLIREMLNEIENACKEAINEDTRGVLDVINKYKNHYEKINNK